MRTPRMHARTQQFDLHVLTQPPGLRFLLCSCTSYFNQCSKPVKTFACTHVRTATVTEQLLQLVLQKVCQNYT